VLSLAQGESADADDMKEILVLSGRSMGDLEHHVQVATRRYRLAVLEPAERRRRREEFEREHGATRTQLEATVQRLQEEIAERRRQLEGAHATLQDIQRRDNEMSQRSGSEGRQAKAELARTRDPQMLRELDSLGKELGFLQQEQRQDFEYLRKHRPNDDTKQAAALQYRAEEFHAAGRAVPQEITRDQAAIQQRLAGVKQVEERMQERQQRMDQTEARVRDIHANQWDWRLMDFRTPEEIERDAATQRGQASIGPDPYGPTITL
jgi:hypothetical protein